MNSYEKGKRWGYAIFKKNCEDYGQIGIAKSDKASQTCAYYARDMKRQGKNLTKDEKDFYKGAADGFQSYYNKFFS